MLMKQYKSGVVICMTLLFAALSFAAEANPNVLVNPGFEEQSSGSLPKGYQKGTHYGKRAPDSSYVLDNAQSHSGDKSLKLVSQDGNFPTIVITKEIEAKPDENFLFTCYLKSENETPLECRIFLISSDFKCVASKNIFVRNNWKQYHVKTKINHKQKSNRIFARVEIKEKGAIWVDDLSLSKIDENADLSYLDKTAYGYRERPTEGAKDVEIRIGDLTGKKLPFINGVCQFKPQMKELKLKVVRVHNVLTSFGILSRSAEGKLQYNWEKLDGYIDNIIAIGAVPQMSLCFVPMELVENPDKAKMRKDYTPPIYLAPPTDMQGWEEYIAQLVKHCAEKYNISKWYWIFGNEPGVAQFSMGTESEFYNLYKHTVTSALKVYPKIKIGAGSFAHMNWLRNFIQRCGKDSTHVGILSWHHYGIMPEDFLTNIKRVKKWIAPYATIKNCTLAIDEWNPLLPDNGTPLSANEYAAAQCAATVKYMMDGGLDYHAFFIAQGGHRRNGLLSPDGVRNPTFNLFKMYSLMGEKELGVTVPDNEPYVGAIAAENNNGNATVLVWNAKYTSDLNKDLVKNVAISLGKKYAAKKISVYMIDKTLSNGYNYPDHQQLEQTTNFSFDNGTVKLPLPSNSVALIISE